MFTSKFCVRISWWLAGVTSSVEILLAISFFFFFLEGMGMDLILSEKICLFSLMYGSQIPVSKLNLEIDNAHA